MSPMSLKENMRQKITHNVNLSVFNPRNRLINCYDNPHEAPSKIISGALLVQGNIDIIDIHNHYIPRSSKTYKPNL